MTSLPPLPRQVTFPADLTAGLTEDLRTRLTDRLQTGCRLLAMAAGCVTQIEDAYYTIQAAIPQAAPFRVGEPIPLTKTSPVRAVAQGQAIAWGRLRQPLDLVATGESQSPLVWPVHIGAPIWVQGKLYGTLHFVSHQPREDFSERDQDLMRLLADDVGLLLTVPSVPPSTQAADADLLARYNQAIIAAIPDLMIRVGQDGVYRDYIPAKDQAERLTDQRIGRHISEVLPAELVSVHQYYLERALETGQTQIFEQELLLGDSVYREEVRMAVSGDEEVLVMVRDITARCQAERALREAKADLEKRVAERTAALMRANEKLQRELQERKKIGATLREAERRWRMMLENMRLLVVTLNESGQVDYANPYFLTLTGYEPAAIMGQDWLEVFLPPAQRERFRAYLQALLQGEPVSPHHQHTLITSTQQERAIAWNTALLRDFEGQITGVINIGEDVTERHAIQRMKDEFVSVVSHELRTPLTSIHGALNLLVSGLIDGQSERGQRVMAIAAESSDRLVRLVNDILELERLESGKIHLQLSWWYTSELTQRAVELMQVMADRSDIHLLVQDPGFDLYADGDRLIQVLTNLLDNAVKFSEPGHTIEVSVNAGPPPGIPLPPEPIATPCLCFQVEDNGRGIPLDQQADIFERFSQVDASDSRRRGGTGLGLAICRNIVEQHGGYIWVHSQPGQGSCFYFTIPLAIPAALDSIDPR